jgi:rhomboid protease GluP
MEIVLGIVIVNVLLFVLPFVVNFSGRYPDSFSNFLAMGWKSNVNISQGEYYRLFTSTFLHGDLTHLVLNMLSLWNVSPIILQVFKPTGFIIIYLLSGIAGSFASYQFNSSPSIGASGSIFGLLGALLAYSLITGQSLILRDILINIVIIVLYSMFINNRIDNFGHAGGLAAGFTIALILMYTHTLVRV